MEREESDFSEPQVSVTRWRVEYLRDPHGRHRTGTEVTYRGGGQWVGAGGIEASTGRGDEPGRTVTRPLPPPRVRKGVETRYRNGRWEKLLRSGWVEA